MPDRVRSQLPGQLPATPALSPGHALGYVAEGIHSETDAGEGAVGVPHWTSSFNPFISTHTCCYACQAGHAPRHHSGV